LKGHRGLPFIISGKNPEGLPKPQFWIHTKAVEPFPDLRINFPVIAIEFPVQVFREFSSEWR
jgi:hypothetical protein